MRFLDEPDGQLRIFVNGVREGLRANAYVGSFDDEGAPFQSIEQVDGLVIGQMYRTCGHLLRSSSPYMRI